LRKIALQLSVQARSLIHVRRAYYVLQNTVSLTAVSAQDCVNHHYHRLNEDYRPLHALCRFFLEQSGPSYRIGDRTMLPFLVDMARLYELFVAEWLKAHSEKYLKPRNLEVKAQERVYLDDQKSLHFNIDLVLRDTKTGKTRYVLDTKYKTPVSPSSNDTAKINTYAAAQDCCEAVLVYPKPLEKPFNGLISQIRIRCLTFALAQDLERCGQRFINALFETV
ncbi:MAG: restriction endonuclease, partial [Cyanobacteria bacterium P01_F01_bin.42]